MVEHEAGTRPIENIGKCGYCDVPFVLTEPFFTVNTVIGEIRLCHECARREPYALAVSLERWRAAGEVPASWRKTRERVRSKKRGKRK